ncbi:MAG TPA: hypothetical protein VGI40_07620 [Pirellulaceae bacterium]|jgi:hypothetical protein
MSATTALAAAPAETTDEAVQSESNEVNVEAPAPTPAQPAEVGSPVQSVPEIAQPPSEQVAGTAHPTNEREQAVARIRQSALPPALRERLAAVVEAGQSPSLDVAACLEAIEQTLPDFLRTNRENVSQPTHPVGNAFFQGGDGELSDAEAEALAARQLSRSGLLRGQRVKVAD